MTKNAIYYFQTNESTRKTVTHLKKVDLLFDLKNSVLLILN